MYDIQSGTTTRVSITSTAGQTNGISEWPSISSDGNHIAYVSYANNIISGDTNTYPDIFLYNTQNDTTSIVSANYEVIETNNTSHDASISPDGNFIAYRSSADNILPGDTNNTEDIFVYDIRYGSTERVSLKSNGTEANNTSYKPSFSSG